MFPILTQVVHNYEYRQIVQEQKFNKKSAMRDKMSSREILRESHMFTNLLSFSTLTPALTTLLIATLICHTFYSTVNIKRTILVRSMVDEKA